MVTYNVKSAQRVLELLEFFAEWRRPASVKEICQSLGYPQSSTSVLLKSLTESGYFDHELRTGMYVPNVRMALATAWIEEHLFSELGLLRSSAPGKGPIFESSIEWRAQRESDRTIRFPAGRLNPLKSWFCVSCVGCVSFSAPKLKVSPAIRSARFFGP